MTDDAPPAAPPAPATLSALEARRGELAAEYLRALRPDADTDAAVAPGPAAAKLDALYWDLVEAWQVQQGAGGRADPLDEDMRLLIDGGLPDRRLAPADAAARLKTDWSANGDGRVLYLSEWLHQRVGRHRAELELGDAADGAANYAGHLEATRRRAAASLGPLLDGLPGTPREVASAFRSGQLDDQLLRLGVSLLAHGGRRSDFLRRSRLKSLRDGVMAKIAARAESSAVTQCLDLLQDVYRKDWLERRHQAALQRDRPAPEDDAADAGDDALREALAGDVRRVRETAGRAARLGGEPRALPFRRDEQPFATRGDAARTVALARALDREGAEPPPIVFVPMRGRGAYAFELDCLVTALRPSVDAEDAVATALGDWRARLDAEQGGGALARAYAERFPSGDFADEFPATYRLWLCRTAKGDGAALSHEWWAFFRDFIGPPMDGPIVPANLRQLSAMARQALRQRLERQLAQTPDDANLYARFGALCWMDGLRDEARTHLKEALRRAPHDGEIALSLGLALRADGDGRGARALFEMGADRAGHTIWGLYCADAAAE